MAERIKQSRLFLAAMCLQLHGVNLEDAEWMVVEGMTLLRKVALNREDLNGVQMFDTLPFDKLDILSTHFYKYLQEQRRMRKEYDGGSARTVWSRRRKALEGHERIHSL